jgi:hypothetical protein
LLHTINRSSPRENSCLFSLPNSNRCSTIDTTERHDL